MRTTAMQMNYIDAAMRHARYEILADDSSTYGEIPECRGVYANADTMEACRTELAEVLEDWLLVRVQNNLALPIIDGFELKIEGEGIAYHRRFEVENLSEGQRRTPPFGPILRQQLICALRASDFDDVLYSSGKHPIMFKGDLALTVPNSHQDAIGRELLARILRQAGVSLAEWTALSNESIIFYDHRMQLITVATFLTPEDAEVARLALKSEGIATFLADAATIGLMWDHGNALGWVKLQVAEDDTERASEILSQHVGESTKEPPLRCPACGVEVPANFAICWACESPMDGSSGEPSASTLPVPATDETEDAEPPAGDAVARRALMAAMFGIYSRWPLFIYSLFCIYSLWLLLRLAFQEKPLSRKGNWFYWSAALIDMAVILPAIWMFWGFHPYIRH
jgi:predicted RNase H-like HicB family nuclease